MGWTEFFTIVERQGGIGARSQALACGVSGSAYDRRVNAEAWDRPYPGTIRVPGAPYGPRERHRAALLAVGGDAALTAESALWWWAVTDRPPPSVTLLLDWKRRAPRLRGVRAIRSRTIAPWDLTERDGAGVATLPRAFVDLAGRVPPRRLRATLIDARQRGAVSHADVAERALAARGVPGRARLLRILAELVPGRADSILTQLVFEGLVAEGFNPDPVPVAIRARGLLLHPDVTISSHFVALECDGYGFHAARSDLELDNRKINAYVGAGWKALRIDWGRFENDWGGFLVDLRDAMDRPV